MMQLTLPTCVLPGCSTPVGEHGDVCQGCRTAFGSLLRPGPRLTEEQITERDQQVRSIYEARKINAARTRRA